MITKPKKKTVRKKSNPNLKELEVLETTLNDNNNQILLHWENKNKKLKLYGKLTYLADDEYMLVANDGRSILRFSLKDIKNLSISKSPRYDLMILLTE